MAWQFCLSAEACFCLCATNHPDTPSLLARIQSGSSPSFQHAPTRVVFSLGALGPVVQIHVEAPRRLTAVVNSGSATMVNVKRVASFAATVDHCIVSAGLRRTASTST